MSIESKLKKAVRTARERGKVYGHDGSEVIGRAIAMLFPDGLTLKTPDDFARFSIFNMQMAKIGRYARNFSKGGHGDSAHDTGVYSFILEDLDDRVNNRKRQQPRANADDHRSKGRKLRGDNIKGVRKQVSNRGSHSGNFVRSPNNQGD